MNSMKSTTVKVDAALLKAIEEVKSPSQTVTAFVRTAVQKAIDRHRLEAAAVAYRAFVQQHPREREWLAEWEAADLAASVVPKKEGR